MAGKLSMSYKERDGYVESLVSNLDDFNSYDSTAIRGQLLSNPSDSLELLLTADYSENNSISPGRNVGTKFLQAQIVDAGPYDPGFYENLLSEEPHSDIESWGLSLQADWDIGGGKLTSITAYREADADVRDLAFAVDYQYLGLASLDNFFVENGKQLSQEVRYAVDLSDSLFMQTGVYYLNEQVDRIESSAIVCGLICRVPASSPITLPTASADQHNETDSYGVFGQAVWSITDRLDLTVGARYTYESKDASNVGTPDGAFVILQPYDVKMSDSWDAFTPMVALDYKLNDSLSTYATISTGFKSGGYQGVAPTAIAASTPFDEENVTNYELGLKGTILDDTLRFGLAAFNTQYDDLQVLILTVQPNGLPGPQLTTNAGKAQIQGVELEAQWAIGSYFQLLATYAYLDTEYEELESNLEPYEGNRLRNAPKNSYSLSGIFDYSLDSGSINARADYTYKDDSFQDIQNQPEAAIPSYDLLNLRLAYSPASQRWEIAAWLKNALDEEYLVHNSVLNPGLAQLPVPAAPRTWGLTATLNFGN
jgi:iron complex outermembrane receptor protein